MNRLNNVKSLEQVYSAELNQVLIKTPPKLFSYALIIFAVCLFIIMLISFIFEYEKNITMDYVFYPSELPNKIEILFFSDKIMDSVKKGKSIFLTSSEKTEGGNVDKIPIVLDSIHISKFYKHDDKLIKLEKSNIEQLSTFSTSDITYKYTIFSEDQTLLQNFNQFQIGEIYISEGKVKFYKMFFSF